MSRPVRPTALALDGARRSLPGSAVLLAALLLALFTLFTAAGLSAQTPAATAAAGVAADLGPEAQLREGAVQERIGARGTLRSRATADGARGDARDALGAPKAGACIEQRIACGETITSTIEFGDCETDSGVLYDVFLFSAVAGEEITVTMSSQDFDPFLVLFDPDIVDIADDDNSGPGNAARITWPIDRTSSEWSVTATPLEVDVTGVYDLTLTCDGGTTPPPPPPNDGFFSSPEFPDFRFRVEITSDGQVFEGFPEPLCLPETVCVSGQVPGRSEAFVRIIGPRPNGYLWPVMTKFTPARVEVWIRQISTGDEQHYILRAAQPGTDALDGFFDRLGFLP